MAEFKFEGEVDSLTPRQLEFLSGILQKRGLKGNKVVIETLGQAGDNYGSSVKKITTTLDTGETFSIIAKLAPTSELQRMGGGMVILFGNECAMYNDILPKLVSLQKAAGVPKEEIFRFPECYGTLMEPMNEMVLLEDLKQSNFEMLDRFTPLTNESVRKILKKFAELHSLSFVLRKQDPDLFDSYKEKLSDMYGLMTTIPEFKDMFPTLEISTISMMDEDKYIKACTGTISQISEHLTKVKKYYSTRYSVVTHGDCWTNNFMFRLKDNVPVEVILIDYQMSNVVSPACDLMYMIFTSTDYSTRHQYYHEWIDYYHSELDKYLSNFGMKASSVYNRDQLDADLRRHSKVYFALSVVIYSVIIRNPVDAAKVKEAMENNTNAEEVSKAMSASSLNPEAVALFKSKVKGLVDSYIELGYLG